MSYLDKLDYSRVVAGTAFFMHTIKSLGVHDSFLYPKDCQEVSADHPYRAYLIANNLIWPYQRDLMAPSEEYLQWAEEAGVEFVIHGFWGDGCSVALKNPDHKVMVKLRWPEISV